jgi:hypothetical protein
MRRRPSKPSHGPVSYNGTVPIYDPATGKSVYSGLLPGSDSHAPAPVAPAAAPTAAAPMPIGASGALAQDPSYLAFLRASGLSQAIAVNNADRQRNDINTALGIANDDLSANGEQERRGISNSQEDRGVYRSGQTLSRMSDQETGQARRKSAIELAGTGQLGDIEFNLLTNLAGQQVRGAEAGLGTGQRLTLADGENALALRKIRGY